MHSLITFSERANVFRKEFVLGKEKQLEGSPLEVKFLSFDSSVGVEELSFENKVQLSPFSSVSDNDIDENIHFIYPVFKYKKEAENKGVIILLHGLNERTWDKYLPWAERLAIDTGKIILLFPISFHMNRSPRTWSDPRAMMPYVAERKNRLGNFRSLSFFNIALSNRLTDSPFRFYSSGKQTVINLINLIRQIKEGEVPFIGKNPVVDIFAYSIGGFLSQILLMANPRNLFSETKLFLFCSGSVFDEMNGNSKSIMDEETFAKLKIYYNIDFSETYSPAVNSSVNHSINQAFKNMINMKGREERESFFAKAKNRIKILSLKKDTVIPATSVVKSLGNKFIHHSYTETDFPFNYSHENPFPLKNTAITSMVNRAFDNVFYQASSFLA